MILTPQTLDSQVLRETFAHFPSGVAAMTAEVDGAAHALVASSFTVGVSLEPALVMFAVQKSSGTWPILRQARRVGVSILGQDQGALCRQLANRDKNARFADVEVHRLESGALLLPHASLWFECSIFDEHPAGDHDVVLLEIHALHADKTTSPLVFHDSAFRQLAA
ncbi:flavin reductase family protein [Paeniglutamicibacter sulfureus]|uniref:Flavin reductase (DIM6/NTAB) family NADH-FMN oxidoreductase RutF n=1 Tax=Paeniglutamicibacter sulfureus TaxID=43666 RepID=A0ABU2BNB9_9MICC|nr:flavin reductase family protein [Paeniglutamicibacter sulfureus]MDR7358834.1 flavin reductase (DIM6/NTAB) family NADH-FMN oxidoreductase RutF [Paeniglutamicibacter sulfureus]